MFSFNPHPLIYAHPEVHISDNKSFGLQPSLGLHNVVAVSETIIVIVVGGLYRNELVAVELVGF